MDLEAKFRIVVAWLHGRIQRGFSTGPPGMGSQLLTPNLWKVKDLKVILNELFPKTMSNTTDMFIIISFSIVNNPYPYHPCMFITENYSSKFTIMCLWDPAPKSPAENGISQKYLDTSLDCSMIFKAGRWLNCNLREYGVKSGNKKSAINSANAYIKYCYIKGGKEWQSFHFSMDKTNF